MTGKISDRLKVVIYSFDQPKWACAHIRILQYLRQWPSDIEIIYGVEFGDDGEVMVNDSCVDTGDIFILQRFFPCLDTRDILNRIWKSGKPVIYETDDLLTEILARAMQKPDDARMISDVIRKADLVTVSTQMLLDKYKPLSRNIKMIPNYIDEGLWVHKFLNKHDTDKLVIGYCGTPTHTRDLGIVEDALIQVLNKYPDKVILRMYGCGTERLNSLTNVECREFSENYFDYVYQSQKNSIDIAIAPIADNTFNLCKSNIKWLEYSVRGIAGIFSDVGPYKTVIENGKTGVLVENTTSAWFEALELLIESDSLRKRLASNAQQLVHQQYSLNKDRVDYLTLLKNLVADSQSRKNTDINPVKDINLQSLDTSLDMNEANDRYQLWVKQRQMSEIDGQIYAERMVSKWSCRPSFHVFCQTTGGGDADLARTIQSLISQLYSQWSLTVISDEACHIDGLMDVENIVWLHSSNTTNDLNAALRDSSEDWFMLLKSGSLLEPNTLIEYADYINENQEWVCIYSDHDSYEYADYYKDPFLKPDINKEYLFSMDYVGDAVAFKRQSVIDAGAYNNYKYYKNYDMLLRVISGYGSNAIGHIHNVLFHFYETGTNYSESDHRAILNSYFSGKGVAVDILQGYLPETLRIIYQHKTDAMVSIIIPTRDMLEYLQPCVESIFERTVYKAYELIVVDNGSEDPDVFEFYQQMQEKHGERFRVLEFPFDFNYSAMINLGVEHSRGDYVLQLNNDTRVMQDEWLGRLMHHAQREEVGIVGAKLLFPGSGTIQHAGVFLGMHEIAGHPYMGHVDSKSPGYMNRAQVDQEFSAVTGACLLARKNIYQQVGGMDYESFKISYNDIDLCLKVKEAGYSVIWTAYSILLHHGSVSQVETHTNLEKKLQSAIRFRGEQDTMVDRWRGYIKNDPAYNRQLSLPEVIPQPDFTCVINWHGASKERPRILGMPVSGGSGEYRVKAPLRSLARAGVAQIDYSYSPNVEKQRVLLLSELIRSEADAILVQNFLGDDSQDALEKYKKHADVFISYALDDLITHLPEGNECRKNIPANARTRLRKALKSCDRLIVSTEPLYDLCKNMIDDIVIIPNSLEPAIWADLRSSRSTATKPRVGWAGAHQHSDDLEFIEDVVKATAHEIDWIFFGMCPDNIRHHVSEIHGFELDFEKYAEKLASLNLDLAIAPLMQHPFNEAKSNLRLLEYGVMGWPVICTDIFPYQNAPVKRVRNDTTAWIDAIRERIYDLDAAYREGDQLREWVMSGHMLHQHVDIWSESLLSGEIKDSYRDVWQENKAILSQ